MNRFDKVSSSELLQQTANWVAVIPVLGINTKRLVYCHCPAITQNREKVKEQADD